MLLSIGDYSVGVARENDAVDKGGDNFLRMLHARLALNSAHDAMFWVDDGTRFKVRPASHESLLSWFGMSSNAFRQILESLDFQCREERESGEQLFKHSAFSRCKLPSAKELIESSNNNQDTQCEETLRMPDVSYNPTLNPLEVRVKCSRAAASQNESWQVVIASSLRPGMTSSERVASYFIQQEQLGGDKSTPLGADMYSDSERCQSLNTSNDDREPESYSWINRPSESSSLCLDDLTDIDILSQISAYYG